VSNNKEPFVLSIFKATHLFLYSIRFFFSPPQAASVQQTLRDIKASNQQAQFLGNRVEVAITNAVEKNKTLLRVGLHFEFGDCRYAQTSGYEIRNNF
jgi:hypothetical protein